MVQELDNTDLAILRELQNNCRLTSKELSQKVNLSTTPTFERQRRLERLGFIHKYIAILDAEKLGRGFVVLCSVSMRQINKSIASDFAKAVSEWNEVTECYNTSGDSDYILKICVGSMSSYQDFLLNKLGTFEYIAHIKSTFIMDTLKHTYGLPI